MHDPIVPIPSGFKVFRENGNLVILRKWWHPRFILTALFCLGWNAFLYGWYTSIPEMPSDSPLGWILYVGPIAHVALGIWLTYYTLAGFFNKTIFIARQGELSITHDPMWWPGSKTYRGTEIVQLFVKAYVNRGVTYELWKVDGEHKSKKLINNIEREEDALFLENTLERELGIEDQPVKGEVKTRE